jgi:hypothetical protein
MELERARAVSNPKQKFQRSSFPITIFLSILISGVIGFTASQIAVKNSVGNTTEINTMMNQVNEARKHSLKVIETELPKIISDLDKYNQDLNFLVNKVEWLNGILTPIKNALGGVESAITAVRGVGTFVDLPIVGNISTNVTNNISTKIAIAQIQLADIDSIIFDLKKLTVIQQDMSKSHQKLSLLFEEYQEEKSIEKLLQIEKELNSNLIYQIEDLRNTTVEARKVFELSSSVLITVEKTIALYNSIQKMGKNTLNAIQFWKENDGGSEIEADIKESLEKDLKATIENIQKLPNELTQRSMSSITSINNVQKELQTIKIAQMVTSE